MSAGLALAFGVVFAGGVTVSAQDPGEYPPYCSREITKRCLKPLEVRIRSACTTEGGLIRFSFNNENRVNAPRIITVYLNGEEFFEDNGFAEPGLSTLQFGPLPNGEWRVVVHWEGLVFADRTFNFTCVQSRAVLPAAVLTKVD